MSEKKYTAADFAAAEFAKRPNGDMAARLDPEDTLPWRVVNGRGLWSWFNDYDMAEEGWVPVPSSPATPTITESELRETIMGGSGFADAIRAGVTASLSRLGIEVVPDPEPTNAEKIIELMGKAPASLNRRDLAKWLDEAGVKAPGDDDDH